MFEKKPSDFVFISILFFSCLIAYWPLTFSIFSLKNDALNYFLPVRFQISEAISNGEWPFWSPYFNLGYPLHGDMQSGVWNPFVWLFSLTGPYTLKTLQWETIFYVFVSGLGMFYLVKHFLSDKKIALFAAMSFMLCGYNSDSAQFLNWISSASFIPFVLLFYYRLLTERSWRMALLTGLFLYLLFVTAYPADFIIQSYLLTGIGLWFAIQKNLFKNWKQVIAFTKLHIYILLVFIVLSLPAIISYIEFLPLTERGTGASYEDAMSNPLHPILLFSYTTPLAVWRATEVYITDPLERNNFIGIITFISLLIGLLKKTNEPFQRFCKWAFFIFLLFSFGEIGGLRILAYYCLPLMDSFRHPANAKIFTNLFGCVIAAFTLHTILIEPKKDFKHAILPAAVLLTIMFTATIIWSLNASHFQYSHFTPDWQSISELKEWFDQLSFSEFVLFNTFLQIPFITGFFLWYRKRYSIKWLIFLSAANCIIHTSLFQPFTVVKKDSVKNIQRILDSVQHSAYPLPNTKISIEENSKEGDGHFEEIGALNMYNKKVGRIDYRITPSNLLYQNEFWFNSRLRNQLVLLPLFFKADTAIAIIDSFQLRTDKHFVVLQNNTLIQKINQENKSDYNAKFMAFSPNQFSLSISSETAGFYSLFQSYYPRWKVYIDDIKTDPIRTNVSFMGVWIPNGTHEVVFQYQSTDLKIASLISAISVLIIIGITCYKPRSFSLS